jgi:hypothetical protein
VKWSVTLTLKIGALFLSRFLERDLIFAERQSTCRAVGHHCLDSSVDPAARARPKTRRTDPLISSTNRATLRVITVARNQRFQASRGKETRLRSSATPLTTCVRRRADGGRFNARLGMISSLYVIAIGRMPQPLWERNNHRHVLAVLKRPRSRGTCQAALSSDSIGPPARMRSERHTCRTASVAGSRITRRVLGSTTTSPIISCGFAARAR